VGDDAEVTDGLDGASCHDQKPSTEVVGCMALTITLRGLVD
jgi:hypothetical protein